jgi:hypothetical protein
MRSILVKTINKYNQEHDSERITNLFADVQEYLEAFAKGIKPDKELAFGFVCEAGIGDNHELEYMDFHFESEMIQVSSGGSVYDKAVGSDSYTNWVYSIWLNGWDEDNHNYRFYTMLEMVRSGAKLSIEGLDEFI